MQHAEFFRFIASYTFCNMGGGHRGHGCMQHVRAQLYEAHPNLHNRAGTLVSTV